MLSQFHFSPVLLTLPLIADFPPDLFRQLTTCQTAANEFLRQFWTSIYPPPSEHSTPTSTAAQRSAKVAKMAGYLGKTHEKVDALVRAAVMEGVEGNRVVVVSRCFLFPCLEPLIALSALFPHTFSALLFNVVRFLIYNVIQAMKPLMDAVEHALAFHRGRSAALEKPGGIKFV